MTQNNIILGGFTMEAMETMTKVLKAIINRVNITIDHPEASCSCDYAEGLINAYINAIDEIENATGITVDVNPMNGHLYIAK